MSRGTGRPSIAVIVPNRNDARYLPRCLRSVLEQDAVPDELIVVDDLSTDESVRVIESHIDAKPYARLVRNPVNLGVYGAIDAGLKVSTSDYALFLAANDFAMPGLIARAKACLGRAPGVGLWSALAWQVDEQDRLLRLQDTPVVALRDAIFAPDACRVLAHRIGNWFTGPTLIYHRPTLDAVGGFDPAFRGLSDMITALAVASLRGAAYSPVPLGVVRVHAGSHLAATLADPASMEAMLQRLSDRGPQISAGLFSEQFLERTAQRLRFAVVRASRGRAIGEVAARGGGLRSAALTWVGRLPLRLHRTRVALSFLVLRPYDVWPTLWNRVFGGFVARIRSPWRPPA